MASKSPDGVGAEAVEQVNHHAGALDVAQELVAQPAARVRALDQAGDVGQHEIAVIDHHHAQVGTQGGEGIVGDLGLGAADHRQQGGFAGVGHADDAHVGDQLELQAQPQFLARLALLGHARRLVGGALEGRVAAAAAAAAHDNRLLAVGDQIGDQLVAVAQIDDGAGRHGDDAVLAGPALLVGAAAVAAALRLEMHLVLKGQQRVEAFVGAQDHVAALAAVAAGRTAVRDVFLAAKGDEAVAAVTTFHIDGCFVEKEASFVSHLVDYSTQQKRSQAYNGASCGARQQGDLWQ